MVVELAVLDGPDASCPRSRTAGGRPRRRRCSAAGRRARCRRAWYVPRSFGPRCVIASVIRSRTSGATTLLGSPPTCTTPQIPHMPLTVSGQRPRPTPHRPAAVYGGLIVRLAAVYESDPMDGESGTEAGYGALMSTSANRPPSRPARIARTPAELQPLLQAWKEFTWPRVDADPAFLATLIETLPAGTRPHVAVIDGDGEPTAMLVGRVEETRLPVAFGYRTSSASRTHPDCRAWRLRGWRVRTCGDPGRGVAAVAGSRGRRRAPARPSQGLAAPGRGVFPPRVLRAQPGPLAAHAPQARSAG